MLLIGVDMRRNTTIHVAEVLAQIPYWHPFRVPVQRHRRKVWIESAGHAGCSAAFDRLTPLLDARGTVRYGRVGHAASRLMRQRSLVDTAERLLRQDPLALLCVEGSCETCDRARAFLGQRPSFDEAAAWACPGGTDTLRIVVPLDSGPHVVPTDADTDATHLVFEAEHI